MIIGVTGLTVALAVGVVVLYTALQVAVTSALDEQGRAAANQVAAMVNTGNVPDPIPVSGAQLIQVIDQQNRVVDASVTADRLTPLLRPAEVTAALGGATVTVGGARAALAGPLRVVAVTAGPADNQQTVLVALQVGDVNHSSTVLRTVLLIGFPVLVLVLAGIAWRVIGWALRPVERLRAGAERISGSDDDLQLPVPAARDEIRALAQTLNGMLGRLAAARSRQRDFVADAAHELRSPLASMRTQLEVAKHLGEAGELPADLLQDVQRLTTIVDDLLLLARTDGGRPARRTAFDVRAMLQEVAARYVGPVTVEVAAGPAVRLTADREELRRAVGNLTDNATRYAAGVVTLSVQRSGTQVRIGVTDDGPGIPAADRERVFQRFARLDSSRDRDTGGSGLGLTIVRELVGRAGGTVAFYDADPPATLCALITVPVLTVDTVEHV
ncbi:sensor histidine kinase [Nakamurella lactea]|uniref:sensor histidine kinase n=1 Tax=Nakamurella lactea TaxID=459515 RepID=UPI00048A7082